MENDDFFRLVGMEISSQMMEVVRSQARVDVTGDADAVRVSALTYTGVAVMRCAYALYLDTELAILDVETLAKRLTLFVPFITSILYETYGLGEFGSQDEGSQTRRGRTNANQVDVASRLVAAIYLEHGFWKALEFIEDYFEDAPRMTGAEYKDLVKRFAQKSRKNPNYKITGRRGRAGSYQYTCTLTIGASRASGSGPSRKKAETEAAKAFVEDVIGAGEHDDDAVADTKTMLEDGRLAQLDLVRSELGIGDDCLELADLDEALTHWLYAAEHPGALSNASLSFIGARLIDMLACEHAWKTGVALDEVANADTNPLVGDAAIAQFAPDSVCSAVRVGVAFDLEKRANGDAVLADAVRGVLALLMCESYTNHVLDKNLVCEPYVRTISRAILDIATHDDGTRPREAVRQLADEHRLALAWGCISDDRAPCEERICIGEVTVEASAWTVSAQGSAASERGAEIEACRAVLPLLRERLSAVENDERVADLSEDAPPKGEASLAEAQTESGASGEPMAQTEADDNCERTTDGVSALPAQTDDVAVGCEEAQEDGEVDATLSVDAEVPDEAVTLPGATEADTTDKGSDGDETKTGETELPQHYPSCRLYVCRSHDCERLGHVLRLGLHDLEDLDGGTVELKVWHCVDCGVDLVDYADYRRYRTTWGPLLGSHTIVRRWHDGAPEPLGANEPALMMAGYAANGLADLSDDARHAIIWNAVEHGTVSREVAADQLAFFVAYAQRRPSMARMARVWRGDLEWLREGPLGSAEDAAST